MRNRILLNRRIYVFLLSVYLFFFLFLPPITRVNPRIIMTLLGILYISFSGLLERKIKIRYSKYYLGFVPFVLFVVFDCVFQVLCSGKSDEVKATLISFLLMIIHVTVGVITINVFSIKNQISSDELIRSIANAGIIQLVLVLASYIIAPVRSLFLSLMANNSTSENVSRAVLKYAHFRSYGFANNIFDAFGFIAALIICTVFIHGTYTKKTGLIVTSIILLIIPCLNARTGMMLSAIGIGVCLLMRFSMKRLFKYLMGGVAGILISLISFANIPESTQEWILWGITCTIDLFVGRGRNGVYAEILDNDIILPDNILFGVGRTPESAGIYGVDNGYIQSIWRFGIIGTVLLLFGMTYMLVSLLRLSKDLEIRCMIIVYYVLFVVYLIKIYSLGNTSANVFILSVVPLMICDLKRKDCCKLINNVS